MRYNYKEYTIPFLQTMSKNPHEPPCGDPYKILNLPSSPKITSEQIKKSFRELSLQYHPDKRHLNLSLTTQQQQKLDDQYHIIQEARNFLLKNKCDRTKYDSWEARKKEEIKNLHRMDVTRQKMKEMLDLNIKKELIKKHGNITNKVDMKSEKEKSEIYVEKLRKSGISMRKNYTRNKSRECQNDYDITFSNRFERTITTREENKKGKTGFLCLIKHEKLIRQMEHKEDFERDSNTIRMLFDIPSHFFSHGYYSSENKKKLKPLSRWDNDVDFYYPSQLPHKDLNNHEPIPGSLYLAYERLEKEEKLLFKNIFQKDSSTTSSDMFLKS